MKTKVGIDTTSHGTLAQGWVKRSLSWSIKRVRKTGSLKRFLFHESGGCVGGGVCVWFVPRLQTHSNTGDSVSPCLQTLIYGTFSLRPPVRHRSSLPDHLSSG